MANNFPKFICRPGTVEQAWGVWIEPGHAVDADDLAAKLADGWHPSPAHFSTEGDGPDAAGTERAKPGRKPKVAQ